MAYIDDFLWSGTLRRFTKFENFDEIHDFLENNKHLDYTLGGAFAYLFAFHKPKGIEDLPFATYLKYKKNMKSKTPKLYNEGTLGKNFTEGSIFE